MGYVVSGSVRRVRWGMLYWGVATGFEGVRCIGEWYRAIIGCAILFVRFVHDELGAVQGAARGGHIGIADGMSTGMGMGCASNSEQMALSDGV